MQKQNGQAFFELECMNHRVRSMSDLPLQTEIEILLRVFPVDVWWWLEHHWTLWKVFDHYAHFEMVWTTPPKSNCSCLKWTSNSWLEVLQVRDDGLDHSYEVYRWCSNDKIKTSSSKLSVWMLRHHMQVLKLWKAILIFSCS